MSFGCVRQCPIRSISIKCRKSIDSTHVTRWLIDVLERGVLNLDIDANGHVEIFTCKTMVDLKLAEGFDAMIP